MADPANQPTGGPPLWIYLQIVLGAAAQVGVFFWLGPFWAICSTPLVFATFAAVNLTELEEEHEQRIKRMMTWLTFGAIAVAVLCEQYLW